MRRDTRKAGRLREPPMPKPVEESTLTHVGAKGYCDRCGHQFELGADSPELKLTQDRWRRPIYKMGCPACKKREVHLDPVKKSKEPPIFGEAKGENQ